MIDWESPLGKRALERLETEQVIWLTTVAGSGSPQPRPVWFVWDGSTVTVYTQANARKVAHLQTNPHVALNFNSDSEGGDIQVLLGTATVDSGAPIVRDNAQYLEKYGTGIGDIGLDVDGYTAMFTVALRIEPTRLRGLDPLP